MSSGVVATLQLSCDYPYAPGSAAAAALTGVDGWQEEQLAAVKDAVNALALFDMATVMSTIEEKLSSLQ
jgi:hypothetical protein